MVEVEERRGAASAVAVRLALGDLAAVLLDGRLLKLGVAVESEGLGEADDRRGRGVGPAGKLLGGLEGGLIEVIDDVAGHVLLRAREVVEALGDEAREALAVGGMSLCRGPWLTGDDFVLVPAGFAPRVSLLDFARMCLDRRVSLDGQLRRTNRNMIAFDLCWGQAALFAPSQTLRVLGHDEPSDDAKELFRRCGPIWLTFAAAHLVATAETERRTGGRCLGFGAPSSQPTSSGRAPPLSRVPAPARGSGSPALSNLAMTLGFAYLSETES